VWGVDYASDTPEPGWLLMDFATRVYVPQGVGLREAARLIVEAFDRRARGAG